MRLQQFQIDDVVQRGMCCGCGACAGVAPSQYAMVDHVDEGLRPQRRAECASIADVPPDVMHAIGEICPGHALEHDASTLSPHSDPLLRDAFGPVLGVWEGGANNPTVRHRGSSGGVITALAAFGLDNDLAKGVLHIRARADKPHLNETVLSTKADDVRSAAGSRYAPASPAEGIPLIEAADGPCVFIGKPCDVAAIRKAQRHRPKLDENITLTIALFCAGTPSTRGTLEMLRAMGVTDPKDVETLRYRGHGWPGRAKATVREESSTARAGEMISSLSYEQAWGDILTRHKQWRCKICPDHTGEFADIAIGDPWDVPPANGEPGRSLVVARTERGAAWIARAQAAGAVDLVRIPNERLHDAQPALTTARGAVWGRILALRLCGQAAPRYRGFPMFHAWRHALTLRGKLQSVFGTIRRIACGRHRPVLQDITTTELTLLNDAVTVSGQHGEPCAEQCAAGCEESMPPVIATISTEKSSRIAA